MRQSPPGEGRCFSAEPGVSTESGLPDFRSAGGIYGKQYHHPPEVMVSHSFFRSHPEEFFDFYRREMVCPEARPNAAHRKLAQMEAEGRLTAVITQNIDGLHQAAGSRRVLELHGEHPPEPLYGLRKAVRAGGGAERRRSAPV